jgi:Uma2 family endonuclease
MAHDYDSYEYVKGELIPMAPPTIEHGRISGDIVSLLQRHVRKHQLGIVCSSDTVFQIGESGRKPDAAFLGQDRIPDNQRQASPVPPDLAVEVVSPSDKLYDVQEKVFEYLDAGTRMVWVVEPVGKTVTIYRSRSDIKILTINDTLTGEEVVEGFRCAVTQIFE